MGRTVLGSVAALAVSALFSFGTAARAQSAPEPVQLEEAPATPPPAAEPTAPAPAPAPASSPALAEPPPLNPPPPTAPSQRPGFLRTREELEALKPPSKANLRVKMPDPDFVARSSPWVDFSFTSFYMKDRVGNFLNFGVQAGGYFFEHLRLSARLVAPTEVVRDDADADGSSFGGGGGGTFRVTSTEPSRRMSVLYGASLGLVVSNDRSFVFGPNVGFVRTDVEDYGTAIVLGLPFEWTTSRNLRVGFELSIGHASGGSARSSCITNTGGITTSCGVSKSEREGGTAVVFSYYMGWSLGRL